MTPVAAVEPASNDARIVATKGKADARRRLGDTSVCVFPEHRPHAALPGAVEFIQQLFGRRNTARDVFLDRLQVSAFVVAPRVKPPASREPLLRKRKRDLRQLQNVTACDRRGEAKLRHIVTQL